LFQANEMLGPILVSIHNITYYQRLVAAARQAIAENRFTDLLAQRRQGWESGGVSGECRVEQ
jgi:queuine tRNA-ribosyltransferase